MRGRKQLNALIHKFLHWLGSREGRASDPETAQKRFTMLRLQFNAVLAQFDLFENVITQCSENETGVWLSGLDVVSSDALRLRSRFFQPPAVICYLDRGVGAAIRRARTRLPGEGNSPVAIIKVPLERMVGSGIASSLIHEVGHQAAALLELVESLQPVLHALGNGTTSERQAWQLRELWISEIFADFWSVARVGIASTMGLMGVVSLPRAFMFRLNVQDPHPTPWIRVKLRAAIGEALSPQPAWVQLRELWESYYPLAGLPEEQARILRMLEKTIPAIVAILTTHRLESLRDRTLTEVLETQDRQPDRLRALLQHWRENPDAMYKTRPTLVFASIGQGRADGAISPEEESIVLGKVLTHWALWSTLQAAAGCANRICKRCACRERESAALN